MNPTTARLVIPCYRDGARLAAYLPDLCTALSRSGGYTRVQVVDDGSPPAGQDHLAAVVEGLRRVHDFLEPLIAHPRNHGKGHAIRAGWDAGPEPAWLAFVDADGAVPPAEVVVLLELARRSPQPAVFIADRTVPAGRRVRRFWHRRLGSRLFNAWVRFCLRLDYPDTQCGLKVIPASLYHSGTWREDGFAFDLELLLRARAAGVPVVVQPIAWQEKPGSTVGVGAMLGLFRAAWRLRR